MEYNISAVIPAHNCEKFIARSIESVLGQKYAAAEVIVVDDGSEDGTAAAVRAFEEKVRYIYQERAGASAARNAGIEAARGEWVALLDGDDEWLPGRLAEQVRVLERHPELRWCTGNAIFCLCSEARRAEQVSPEKARRLLGGKDYFENYFDAGRIGFIGHTDTMLIRREALREAGLFRTQQAKANDLDMWWRLAYRWPAIGYVSEPLAIYHLGVPASISQKYFEVEHYIELIGRHLDLSREGGQAEAFERYISRLLRLWLRSMLFEGRGEDIRELMRRFGGLLPGYYKAMMWGLTARPEMTAAGCHAASRVVRGLRLRRMVTRPPRKGKEIKKS